MSTIWTFYNMLLLYYHRRAICFKFYNAVVVGACCTNYIRKGSRPLRNRWLEKTFLLVLFHRHIVVQFGTNKYTIASLTRVRLMSGEW